MKSYTTLYLSTLAFWLLAGLYNFSFAQFNVCVQKQDGTQLTIDATKICLGNTLTLTASGCNNTNTSETYNYQWTDLQQTFITVKNPKFLVQQAGKYEVAVTAKSSNITIKKIITVTYAEKELFTITPSSPVKCKNDILKLKATTPGFKDYKWKLLSSTTILSNNDSLVNPVANREYVVSAISSNGCKVDSNIYIVQAPAIFEPKVDLGPRDTAICEGTELKLKNLITNKYTHLWSTGSIDSTIKVNTIGWYKLTVKTAVCSAQDSILVKAAFAPKISGNKPNNYACFGQGKPLFYSVAGDSTIYKYTWTPTAGLSAANIKTPIAKPSGTTKYFLTVSVQGGCLDTASFTVFINPKISVAINATDTLLCGGDSLQLLSIASGGKPFASASPYLYNWSPNKNINNNTLSNPIVTPRESTKYILTVTDAGDCKDTASVYIKVFKLKVSIDSLAKTDFCINDTIKLAATVTSVDPNYTFRWKTNPLTESVRDSTQLKTQFYANVLGTKTFSAVASDISGCKVTTIQKITVHDKPLLTLTEKYRRICFADSAKVLATALGGSGINYQFSWLPITSGIKNAQTSRPTFVGKQEVVGNKTYTVSVKDSYGCQSKSDSIVIETIPFFVANLGGADTLICEGDSVKLFSINPIPPSFTYTWVNATLGSTVSKNSFIYVSKPGLYQLKVEDAQSGCSNKVTKQVNTTNAPTAVNIIAKNEICPTDTLQLIATSANTNYTTTWTTLGKGTFANKNSDTTFYQRHPEDLGAINFNVSLKNICGSRDTIVSVQFLSAPKLNLAATPNPQFVDSVLVFTNNTALTEKLFWDFRDSSPIDTGNIVSHIFKIAKSYTVIAYTAKPSTGCAAFDSVVVTIKGNTIITELFVPNVFAPSSQESDNQSLKVFGKNIKNDNFAFKVYSRWGQLIYETNSFVTANTIGWNGTNSIGQPIEKGNYTYTLTGVFENDVAFKQSGNVTLLK